MVACVVATIVGLARLANAAATAGLQINDSFPDLAQFKLEGKLPRPLRGHVLLVDFWASWCVPCKASFPALDRLHGKYSERGLLILAVSVDEKKQDMERFLKKTPVRFTVVRDAEQKLVAAANVATMPTSFLIDREGRVRFIHDGYHGRESDQQYTREIEQLLAEESKSP